MTKSSPLLLAAVALFAFSCSNDATSPVAKVYCGNWEYNPETESCCGSNKYVTSTHFCDSRDGKVYKFSKIGVQTWMAENLNYPSGDSKCYAETYSNCNIYGRLYNGNDAKNVCPTGWHLPSNNEWEILVDFEGGDIAGYVLKLTNGFNALLGGNGYPIKDLDDCIETASYSWCFLGSIGSFWSSTDSTNTYAYSRSVYKNRDDVRKSATPKGIFLSCRCLKD
jgi:uncharacterized protein (TIGR02145 family)